MAGYKLLFSFLISLGLHLGLLYSPTEKEEVAQYRVQFKYSETAIKSQSQKRENSKGNKSPKSSSSAGIIQPAKPLTEISPIYPELSRIYKEEGLVVINAEISTDGKVQKAEVKSSSGYERLDQAALQAVYSSKFSPSKEGDTPIPTNMDLEFNFQLN